MSVSPSDDSSPSRREPVRAVVLLRVPDLTGAPGDSNSSAKRPEGIPRGMQVLNRIMARRPRNLWGLSGPNRWRNRMGLATIGLIGTSCLMLAFGMRQPGDRSVDAPSTESLFADEFDDDFAELGEETPHTSAYRGGSADPASEAGSTTIQPASYELPPNAAPRGAWLEGTIQTDDSESS